MSILYYHITHLNNPSKLLGGGLLRGCGFEEIDLQPPPHSSVRLRTDSSYLGCGYPDIENHPYTTLPTTPLIIKSLGKYELAIADNMRRYELEEKLETAIDDPALKEVSNIAHQYFQQNLKPQLISGGEKFVEYWECLLHWGVDQTHSLHKGTQSYAHYGRYGVGYICLSDSYLRIFSFGVLSSVSTSRLALLKETETAQSRVR